MRLTTLITIFLSFTLHILASARQDKSASQQIRWIEKDYDFGLMKEIAGPKTGTSRFVNIGSDTISIADVRPSCGCTSADFSDTPIAPGDTARISYTYNPAMRPGKFIKHVKVRFADNSRASIEIRGNVLGTPESLSQLYPFGNETLHLSDSILTVGEIAMGRAPVTFVNAYVLSTDSVTPVVSSPSDALKISASQQKGGPGDIITYSLDFDSRKHGQYGTVEIPITFTLDDEQPASATFRTFVIPDTEYLRIKQNGKTPACDLSPNPITVSDLTHKHFDDSEVKTEFEVINEGNGPLEILRIYSDDPAITIRKAPKIVKPNKRATVKLTINPAKLYSNPARIPVEVITSDPIHPHLQLFIAIAQLRL